MGAYAHAVARPLGLADVRIVAGFWKRIIDRARTDGLPALLKEYEGRNIVGNFRDTAARRPRAKEENGGNYDEFLFKALEACNYSLIGEAKGDLPGTYERIRDIVLSAQEPDGYLNTYGTQTRTPRHSPDSQQELYAGGHLMQAGLAERACTRETVLFDAARRYIDCLIAGYGEGGEKFTRFYGRFKWPDHPNVEMALVELYRATADEKYLRFCDAVLRYSEFRGRTRMLNHAVCEMLHAAGGTDYYLETGDKKALAAANALWDDMLKKVYVTGGIGAAHRGTLWEAVGNEYALSNDLAYTETCASIGLVFWSWRMFLARPARRYADMLERALYNGVLAGVSLDGREYFYENPLEYRAVGAAGSAAMDDACADFRGDGWRRKAYHHCSCCPPNVQRLLASLQQYLYAFDGETVWVNLFADSEASLPAPGGGRLRLRQQTDYPWDGAVRLTVGLDRPADLQLKIRWPGWCADMSVAVNGQAVTKGAARDGYVEVSRTWQDGDAVTIEMAMPARLEQSHPKNTANYAKLVIARGPLVYCLEGHDNPDVDLFAVTLPAKPKFRMTRCRDLLGSVVLLDGEAFARDDSEWSAGPYRPFRPTRTARMAPAHVVAIPYYAWANRGRSDMVTALPYVGKEDL